MFERVAPEQHDTLDGIPEPAENARLIGHRHAADMLAGAYRANKLPHALLFAGPTGIGKATLAYHLACHLLKHPSSDTAPESFEAPDVASSLFRQVANGAHPSVLHLTRPLNDKTKVFKSAVTVDEIRKVNRFLSHTSHDGGYRVVIVDPADDMNANAANALLKNLEEPPTRTVFVLIAHSLGSLLPTIRSRCQILRLQPLSNNEVLTVLDGFDTPLPAGDDERGTLAQRSGGSPRNAIILTQYGGIEIEDAVNRLAQSGTVSSSDAHRLADAVSGKDKAIQFETFNRHLLDLISTQASDAAHAGDIDRAGRLSDLWRQTNTQIIETETYNLDRKQHALGLIYQLQGEMRR